MLDVGDPFIVAKLEAWRHKMFHIFHFLQSDIVFGEQIPFREYLIPSPVRKVIVFTL